MITTYYNVPKSVIQPTSDCLQFYANSAVFDKFFSTSGLCIALEQLKIWQSTYKILPISRTEYLNITLFSQCNPQNLWHGKTWHQTEFNSFFFFYIHSFIKGHVTSRKVVFFNVNNYWQALNFSFCQSVQQQVVSDWFLALLLIIDISPRFTSAKLCNPRIYSLGYSLEPPRAEIWKKSIRIFIWIFSFFDGKIFSIFE